MLFSFCRSFKLIPLSPQLTPMKRKSLIPKSPSSDSLGPFIYSPIQARDTKDGKPKPKVGKLVAYCNGNLMMLQGIVLQGVA